MAKVLVLLSTYNGEKFLEEQLQSLVDQEGVDVDILVRDDGSTDSTHDILNAWQQEGKLQWYTGENLGPSGSFFNLLKCAPRVDFYAFSDQDDYWMPNKLASAVKSLAGYQSHTPQLYFCNKELVNQDLTPIGNNASHNLLITKGNAFLESPASGCTMVFNSSLRDIVVKYLPAKWILHDRWLFLSAVFFGVVVYDKKTFIKYRQHGGNVVGGISEEDKFHNFGRIIQKNKLSVSDTAGYFLSSYGDKLPICDKQLVKFVEDYKKSIIAKLNLLFSSQFRLMYGGLVRKLYWKLRILFNKI